ncbi:MAG: DciA family protein [Planctomycetota bacterium]
MDEDTRLNNAVQWRRTGKACGAVRLDQAVRELVDEQILPRQARFSQVAEAWSQLLPAPLSRHCEIADIAGGQLDVQVDSPSYLYELQLCSSELLEELQRQCPKVRLTKIKFVVA